MHGEHVFTTSKLVAQFVFLVCQKRESIVDAHLAAQIGGRENSLELAREGIRQESKDRSPLYVINADGNVDVEDELMEDEDAEADAPMDSWISQVMTMPWKELYLEHLQKEGWSWYYGKGSDE